MFSSAWPAKCGSKAKVKAEKREISWLEHQNMTVSAPVVWDVCGLSVWLYLWGVCLVAKSFIKDVLVRITTAQAVGVVALQYWDILDGISSFMYMTPSESALVYLIKSNLTFYFACFFLSTLSKTVNHGYKVTLLSICMHVLMWTLKRHPECTY